MSERNVFSLRYTAEEWAALEKQAESILGTRFPTHESKNHIPHLRSLINSAAFRIGGGCRDCDDRTPLIRTKLEFHVSDAAIFNALNRMAANKGISVEKLMNRLVTTPLFSDIYTDSGF